MNNPPRNKDEGIFSKDAIRFVITRGFIIGLVTIAAQLIGMKHSAELGVAMAFATLTLSRILQTFAARSNSQTIFELGFKSNKYVLGAVVVCLGMFSLTLLPFMREVFTMPATFNLTALLTCFGLALVSTALMEASKFINKK